jgi:hypothetical protein
MQPARRKSLLRRHTEAMIAIARRGLPLQVSNLDVTCGRLCR